MTAFDCPTGPEVSIIIVNWNTRELLRGCIRSIQEQTEAAHEIIVIDNASRDGSAEMVSAEFPDVVLIANQGNAGFAAANNQGLAIAHGAFLLLLNPDTVIINHAIDRSLVWLRMHPDVGCMGCQVLTNPEEIQQTCFADPGIVNLSIVEFGLARLSKWVPALAQPQYLGWDRRSERDVDVVSGMFMLVPRPVISAVGVLDEAFFIYGEEADWCRRIRKAGYRCVFAPVAQILHLDGGGKSTFQVRPRMHVQLQKSHLVYVGKHEGQIGYMAARALFALSAMLRALLFGTLGLPRADSLMRARFRLAVASFRYHVLGRETGA